MEKIGNMQISDNKENKFFCFPMISMACTGSGYKKAKYLMNQYLAFFLYLIFYKNCPNVKYFRNFVTVKKAHGLCLSFGFQA